MKKVFVFHRLLHWFSYLKKLVPTFKTVVHFETLIPLKCSKRKFNDVINELLHIEDVLFRGDRILS